MTITAKTKVKLRYNHKMKPDLSCFLWFLQWRFSAGVCDVWCHYNSHLNRTLLQIRGGCGTKTSINFTWRTLLLLFIYHLFFYHQCLPDYFWKKCKQLNTKLYFLQ